MSIAALCLCYHSIDAGAWNHPNCVYFKTCNFCRNCSSFNFVYGMMNSNSFIIMLADLIDDSELQSDW